MDQNDWYGQKKQKYEYEHDEATYWLELLMKATWSISRAESQSTSVLD
jgi:hypothetical protein